jgi:hypothetical protein
MVDKLDTEELRPFYQQTLMSALRRESSRRQLIPRAAIAQQPELGKDEPGQHQRRAPEAADIEPPVRGGNLLDPAKQPGLALRPGERIGGGRAVDKQVEGSVSIDDVLSSTADFRGKTFSLGGLFKLGTRISVLRDGQGQIVGSTIPVARINDQALCKGEGRIEGSRVYLLLDGPVAGILRAAFDQLRIQANAKPAYRATLGVSVRQIPDAGGLSDALVITSLEMLGYCDYLKVARREYDAAFRVLSVAAEGGEVRPGDGAKWIELLGGEEKFVQPVRRKVRELQRRLATNSRQAMMDGVLQRELGKALQSAYASSTIQSMEGERWRRFLVGRAGLP